MCNDNDFTFWKWFIVGILVGSLIAAFITVKYSQVVGLDKITPLLQLLW